MGAGSTITGILDLTTSEQDQNVQPFHLLRLFWILSTVTDENGDLSYLRPFDLSEYDPRLQKLIQLGRACRPTVHKLFQQEDVVGLNGSVVLVGDAAHTVLIHGSHNSSMAVEDAVTLATLFSHLSNAKQIPVFTETYQELRQHRKNETRMSEYQSLVQITLPDGPLQEERDVTLRLTLDQAFLDFDNCKSLEPVWEQYLVFFNHDAGEVARDWWSNNYHVQLFTH
ncbi:hypothetical protein B0H14DRAFT_3771440 [Mycena olivaceomarginata]|nr:hypothetical protein B0H14DRAFT_3771440 [Mycena olivaceomarginata]